MLTYLDDEEYFDAVDECEEKLRFPAEEAIRSICPYVEIGCGDYYHTVEVSFWDKDEYESYDVDINFDLSDELTDEEKETYLDKIYSIHTVEA